MNKATIWISLVLVSGAMQGCLQDASTGDTTQQEINRENGSAATVANQYGVMKGQYVGTDNQSTMIMTLDVAHVVSTGNGDLGLVPQPTIVGTLQMEPPIFVRTVTGSPMMIPFSITSGQYVSGNDLTLTVQENGSPTTAHCLVSDDLNNLDCNWYMNASTAPMTSFQLHRVQNGQALTTRTQNQGEYTGSDSVHKNIALRFETKLDIQNGSEAIPQNTIGATISFDGVVFQSKGSEFDPINNTLAMVFAGTNPIDLDCAIIDSQNLRCDWSGKNGDGTSANDGQDEVFNLTKSSD
jgi:hypothetical protein